MASTREYVEFVAGQLSGAGAITYRKLFGEYGLYCDGKFFGTVEGNQLYLKVTEAGRRLLPDAEIASPHEGSNLLTVEEVEDREFLAKLVRATCGELPAPKPKKPKASKPKKAEKEPNHKGEDLWKKT